MAIRIEPITRSHVRDDFECGKPSLDTFLRNYALQHDERKIGRTFVAVEEGAPHVIGYYTLASGKVAFQNIPNNKKLPPNMPVPVVLLGRLARDRRYKGQQLGELLLMHALWRAHLISKHLGVYAVEVDALDDQAATFYQRYQFVPLLDDPHHMYLPMKTIEQLGLDFDE
jgi:GNAT superfamily N-acetyltransferase